MINAGAGFFAADSVSSIAEGIKKAEGLIDSGAGYKTLEEFIKHSNS